MILLSKILRIFEMCGGGIYGILLQVPLHAGPAGRRTLHGEVYFVSDRKRIKAAGKEKSEC